MRRNGNGVFGRSHRGLIAGSTAALAVALLTGVNPGGPAAADDTTQKADWQVAITFDDLPLTGRGGCTAERIARVNDALLTTLRRYDVPATGFVVPGTTCQAGGTASADAIARRWADAGHTIGNHSWSHRDFNTTAIGPYLSDIERADSALAPVLDEAGQTARWFRPPLLHSGPGQERAVALRRWISDHSYQIGFVTIDNQEWVFAAAWQAAQAGSDTTTAARVVDAYVSHLRQSIRYYRTLGRRLFRREIPQVLLLHANELNADHLDRVLRMLREAGAEFVPLADAVADPAYASEDEYVGPRGLSWIQRWALTKGITPGPEPREPEWIQRLASNSESVFR